MGLICCFVVAHVPVSAIYAAAVHSPILVAALARRAAGGLACKMLMNKLAEVSYR